MVNETTESQMAKWGHTRDVPERQKFIWILLTKAWRQFAGPIPELSLDVGAAHRKGRSVSLDPFPRGDVDIRAVAENLPFSDQIFTSVVMESVIKHVQFPIQSLKEAHRVVKTGGRLYLTSPLNYTDNHRHSYSFSELCKLIQNAGFKIERSIGFGFASNRLNRLLTRYAATFYTRLRIPGRFCRMLFVVAKANSI